MKFPTTTLESVLSLCDSGEWGDDPVGSNGIPVIRVADVKADNRILFDKAPLRSVPLKKRTEKTVRNGDILVVKSSGSGTRVVSGRVAQVSGIEAGEYGFANFLLRLRADSTKYSARFLLYVLSSPKVREQVLMIVGATTYPNLSVPAYRRIIIPNPPLVEQERIVKLLDEADKLRKLRAQADHRTADLIPALFHEMFGDSLKKTSRLPILPLGEVVDLGSGATPSKENPEFWNGRTPWVSPKDMKAEEITDAEDHVSAAAFEKSNLQLIPKDTVLIVVRGMILAHTVPIRLCRVPVAINQDMKALLPKQPIEPEFLRWSLQAQHPHLLNQVSTAGHGTKKLDSDRLREVTIPVPPLASQKEFAARVSEIRAVQAVQATSRRRLDDLFHSLLHRAFNGKL